MNAPSINGNSKSQEADRETSNVMITKARVWLSETLAAKAPVKILGGLALGALLMAAAALPMGTAHADEPVSPLVAAAISPVGYADEFEDVEAGPGSARATFTTVDYRAEFEDVEAGPGSARATSTTVDYLAEFEDVEAGPGSARATFTTVVYVDQFGDLEAGK